MPGHSKWLPFKLPESWHGKPKIHVSINTSWPRMDFWFVDESDGDRTVTFTNLMGADCDVLTDGEP